MLHKSDQHALDAVVASLGATDEAIVRFAGGALIGDLPLLDNLTLEAALLDGVLPTQLFEEIDTLFSHAGCPVDWTGFSTRLPADASAADILQTLVGRALAADPDVLLIDEGPWRGDLLTPADFTRSFARQYPWRRLVWLTHDNEVTRALRDPLEEHDA